MKLIDWARHQTLQERSEELAAQFLKPELVASVVREPRPRGRRQAAPEPQLHDEKPQEVQPPPQVAAVRSTSAKGDGAGRRDFDSNGDLLLRDLRRCHHRHFDQHTRHLGQRDHLP